MARLSDDTVTVGSNYSMTDRVKEFSIKYPDACKLRMGFLWRSAEQMDDGGDSASGIGALGKVCLAYMQDIELAHVPVDVDPLADYASEVDNILA
jgi:hypothetical protein